MRRISGSWTSEFSTHSGRARFLLEWNRLWARSVTNGTNLGNGHGRSSAYGPSGQPLATRTRQLRPPLIRSVPTVCLVAGNDRARLVRNMDRCTVPQVGERNDSHQLN